MPDASIAPFSRMTTTDKCMAFLCLSSSRLSRKHQGRVEAMLGIVLGEAEKRRAPFLTNTITEKTTNTKSPDSKYLHRSILSSNNNSKNANSLFVSALPKEKACCLVTRFISCFPFLHLCKGQKIPPVFLKILGSAFHLPRHALFYFQLYKKALL